MGSFNNYVDQILPNHNHLPTLECTIVDILHYTWPSVGFLQTPYSPLLINVVIECPPWHTDGLKTDLEGRVEKDGWLSKPSALSNVGVRSNNGEFLMLLAWLCSALLGFAGVAAPLCALASDYNSSNNRWVDPFLELPAATFLFYLDYFIIIQRIYKKKSRNFI